jgi:hypothetical protein
MGPRTQCTDRMQVIVSFLVADDCRDNHRERAHIAAVSHAAVQDEWFPHLGRNSRASRQAIAVAGAALSRARHPGQQGMHVCFRFNHLSSYSVVCCRHALACSPAKAHTSFSSTSWLISSNMSVSSRIVMVERFSSCVSCRGCRCVHAGCAGRVTQHQYWCG